MSFFTELSIWLALISSIFGIISGIIAIKSFFRTKEVNNATKKILHEIKLNVSENLKISIENKEILLKKSRSNKNNQLLKDSELQNYKYSKVSNLYKRQIEDFKYTKKSLKKHKTKRRK